jgi:hypothetical protein
MVFAHGHLAELEAVLHDPHLAVCVDGWWVIGIAKSAELRRTGRGDVLDGEMGHLITRETDGDARLLACWVVPAPEAVAS